MNDKNEPVEPVERVMQEARDAGRITEQEHLRFRAARDARTERWAKDQAIQAALGRRREGDEDETMARMWRRLGDSERAESPDGQTGFQRFTARQPRVKLEVRHDGQVTVQTCDHCTASITELLAVLETVLADIAGRRVAVDESLARQHADAAIESQRQYQRGYDDGRRAGPSEG